ncbi:hypothetical protein A2U01_0046186, partial [Trifolium medium]|nr:hypothetical protein [Trifolium medium]
MEYQAIDESKSSDHPINPSEKSMEDQMIVMEEGTRFSYTLDP